ncbi:MAG TPA: alanyl-tRNA editing protein [Rhodoferax sp.]|nr:alanyl-tRNA editing protein [Rhodoferax sp.]
MTQDLFRQNAYLTECTATVTAITPLGLELDRTVFYPLGGGQAGDTGVLVLADGSQIGIIDTRKGKSEDGSFNGQIAHQPTPDVLEQLLNQDQSGAFKLAVGDTVTARIDWARRLRMMRFHTCSHLLCHIVPQLVNGCSITPDYARIDFNMTEPLDKEALNVAIAQLVAAAHPVTVGAILDAELDANPALVKSMSVQPPRGSGQIRTIQIGGLAPDAASVGLAGAGQSAGTALIDLQPCGGTHVANTAEIGRIVVTKIEKKSAMTRRVVLGFAPAAP